MLASEAERSKLHKRRRRLAVIQNSEEAGDKRDCTCYVTDILDIWFCQQGNLVTTVKRIHSNDGITLEMSALESHYGMANLPYQAALTMG